MVEDAMTEEEESKNVQSSVTENEDDDGENFVSASSLPTSHHPLLLVKCYLKQRKCSINVVSRLLLPLYDVRTGRMSQKDMCAKEEKRT